jgi:hypothetical protein
MAITGPLFIAASHVAASQDHTTVCAVPRDWSMRS